MRRIIATTLGGVVVGAVGWPIRAQQWNAPPTVALVERGIARRAGMQADSALRAFQARAHGFVFFLGQLGEELTTPRLIKADQLVVEVYWRAPGHSKQRIVGWRDRLDLPAGIQYHRDHLGIVTNGFGDRIRLGEGDEVRDVPHPLSGVGRGVYDYALTDSLTIVMPQRGVHVYEVMVRPKDATAPGVAGALYLDADDAELVRFRFTFTRSAYLDPTLEDIAVELENGLWEGRFWLPRRQEIEIRRRTEWLDLPARGIIRGRWEIGEYRLNVDLPAAQFQGPEIVAAPPEQRAAFAWPEPIDAAIAAAAGTRLLSLAEIHSTVRESVGSKALSSLPKAQAGARSVSDIVRVNRVEGLAIGAGWVVRPGGGAVELRAGLSYGTGDRRAKGILRASHHLANSLWTISASRSVMDVGDEPLASGFVNSLLAQEGGLDYGDYVLRDEARIGVRRGVGTGRTLAASLALERTADMDTVAHPVFGSFRANPSLGAGRFTMARVSLEQAGAADAAAASLRFGMSVEVGVGDSTRFARARGTTRVQVPVAGTALALSGWAGWGSRDLPRHRAIVWGGRGAVHCEPMARCGGRYGAAGWVEWRFGSGMVVAPFFTAGYVGGTVVGAPWTGTGSIRPFTGLVVELFHRLVRAEVGTDLKTGRVGLLVDVNRDLWGIL